MSQTRSVLCQKVAITSPDIPYLKLAPLFTRLIQGTAPLTLQRVNHGPGVFDERRTVSMLMADTMAIFFVFLGMLLAFAGLWLLCRGLWPEAVAAAADRCGKRLWPSFLAGLPPTIVMIVLTKILFNVLGPAGKIAGVGVVCLYMLQAHTGVSGLATAIGRRLTSSVDVQSPWRSTLRGGVVLELTYLLPILGWFVILPASIIIGSGATNLALLTKLKLALFARRPAIAQNDPAANDQVGDQVGAA